jgi:hypothetical protein
LIAGAPFTYQHPELLFPSREEGLVWFGFLFFFLFLFIYLSFSPLPLVDFRSRRYDRTMLRTSVARAKYRHELLRREQTESHRAVRIDFSFTERAER